MHGTIVLLLLDLVIFKIDGLASTNFSVFPIFVIIINFKIMRK